jgi:hypothetical protein
MYHKIHYCIKHPSLHIQQMTLTFTKQLSPELVLRVRQPEHNTNGSIMLLVDGSEVWDCVQCCQYSVSRYTEENWVKKYGRLYRFDNDEDTVIKQNTYEERFEFKKSKSVVNLCDCKLSTTNPPLEITHYAWEDNTLELQLTETIEPNKCTIGQTEYSSLVLQFERVFQVGTKRGR